MRSSTHQSSKKNYQVWTTQSQFVFILLKRSVLSNTCLFCYFKNNLCNPSSFVLKLQLRIPRYNVYQLFKDMDKGSRIYSNILIELCILWVSSALINLWRLCSLSCLFSYIGLQWPWGQARHPDHSLKFYSQEVLHNLDFQHPFWCISYVTRFIHYSVKDRWNSLCLFFPIRLSVVENCAVSKNTTLWI